jgi:hypothetical protein
MAGYVVFMATVDVPTYFGRWLTDLATGKTYFGLFAGLHDPATRWVVTHDIAPWQDEIAWMSLYFSVAVWASLMLAAFPLVKHLMLRYRVRTPRSRATRRPVTVSVRVTTTPISRMPRNLCYHRRRAPLRSPLRPMTRPTSSSQATRPDWQSPELELYHPNRLAKTSWLMSRALKLAALKGAALTTPPL